MKFIYEETDVAYVTWIEKFVKHVFESAGIICEEVVIDYIEYGCKICMSVCDSWYEIKTWGVEMIEDEETESNICTGILSYSLSGECCEDYLGEIVIKWEM